MDAINLYVLCQAIDLDNFIYGFSIPQISKEFDLLKIYENGR